MNDENKAITTYFNKPNLYEIPDRRIYSISPSGCKQLDSCDAIYWMSKVKGIEETNPSKGLTLLLGNYADYHTQVAFGNVPELDDEKLDVYFDKEWELIDEIPKGMTKEIVKERIDKAIEECLAFLRKEVKEFVFVNQSLGMTIDEGRVKWSAYPDFIVRLNDGRLAVIDLKCTKNRLAEGAFDKYRFQLEVYRNLAKEILGEEISVIAIYNISVKTSVKPKGEVYENTYLQLDYNRDDEHDPEFEIACQMANYEERAKRLHEGDLPTYNGLANGRCSYCGYKSLCPFKKMENEEIVLKFKKLYGKYMDNKSSTGNNTADDAWRYKDIGIEDKDEGEKTIEEIIKLIQSEN